MPSAWVHAVIDLIVYGRPCFDVHKRKDQAHERLGPGHRREGHEWYQAFGEQWNWDHPFPCGLRDEVQRIGNARGTPEAEQRMVYTGHDYIDTIWDGLSRSHRKYWEGFFAWVLFSARILLEWAGVDVLRGAIQRVVAAREIWGKCPRLTREYNRLCNYVKAVSDADALLRDAIARHSQ